LFSFISSFLSAHDNALSGEIKGFRNFSVFTHKFLLFVLVRFYRNVGMLSKVKDLAEQKPRKGGSGGDDKGEKKD